jgi:hypothetical protein
VIGVKPSALSPVVLLMAAAPMWADLDMSIELLAPQFNTNFADPAAFSTAGAINDMDFVIGTAHPGPGLDVFAVYWDLRGVTSGSVVGHTLSDPWAPASYEGVGFAQTELLQGPGDDPALANSKQSNSQGWYIKNYDTGNPFCGPACDARVFIPSVPEPASLTLLLTVVGALGMAAWRRRAALHSDKPKRC